MNRKLPPLQVNLGLPDVHPLAMSLVILGLGFDPFQLLDEVVQPALYAPIFLRRVGAEKVKWYPLKVPDGASYSQPVSNGQAEVGIGYTQGSLLLLLPRTFDNALRPKLAGIAQGPLPTFGPAGAPASGWRIQLVPGTVRTVPLPGDFNLYLEVV